MVEYRYSKYFYRPRRRKGKLLAAIVFFLILGGGTVYLLVFLDIRSMFMRIVDAYRVGFNDYRFLEKNLESGNYNVVIHEGTPYLARRPYSARLLRYIGEAYYFIALSLTDNEKEEALNKAIRHLRKGIVLSRFDDVVTRSYFILGMAYFRKGPSYYELAAEYLKKANEDGFNDSSIYEVLGYCYFKLGADDRAIEYLTKAKSAASKDIVRLFLAQAYKNKGVYDRAEEELQYLIDTSKDSAILEESYSLAALIDFQLGKYERARENLARVFEINSNSAEAHYWMGNIYEKQGDLISARKEWRTALRIDSKHVGAIEKLY